MKKHTNGYMNYEFKTAARSKWWIYIIDTLTTNRVSVN